MSLGGHLGPILIGEKSSCLFGGGSRIALPCCFCLFDGSFDPAMILIKDLYRSDTAHFASKKLEGKAESKILPSS